MKTRIYILATILFASFFLGMKTTLAHPGRTDAFGCHTCRTNCPSWGLSYGEYHCHRAKALPQPEPPIRSRYGANGTGSTQPAPEYNKPSVSTPRSTSESRTTPRETSQQPKKGFWGWLSGLFSK